jgi:GAF domain-containing protein
MKTPSSWQDEKRRLEVLWRYEVLDTPPEEAFDDFTALAAQICEAPIALMDEKRQWFKSKIGLTASETARDVSFCGHAIHQPGFFIVSDATRAERFADNHNNAPGEVPSEANWCNGSRRLSAKLTSASVGSANHRAFQP